MHKWAWCHEYELDARARGDAERLRNPAPELEKLDRTAQGREPQAT